MAAIKPAGPSKVFSGARARFEVNGKVIGYATNCSGSEEIMYEPIVVLDHMQVIEFAPVGYNVTFTASRVRLMGDGVGVHGSLKASDLGIFPANGSDDEALLDNVLALPEDLYCSIENRTAGKTFMKLENVKVASHNWAVTPRGVVGEDIVFLATRMLDDAET